MPIDKAARLQLLQDYFVGDFNEDPYRTITLGTFDRRKPLIVFGRKGSGKSHLMAGAAFHYCQRGCHVELITGSTFREAYWMSCMKGVPGLNSFRSRLALADMILLDDLSLLTQNSFRQTREELDRTIRIAASEARPVVVSWDSRRELQECTGGDFLEALKPSQVTCIGQPTFADRRRFVEYFSHHAGTHFTQEATNYLASEGVDTLGSLFHRLEQVARIFIGLGRTINLGMIKRADLGS